MPLFCAGGIATPSDAALVMHLGAQAVFVGSGIFKSSDPARFGPGHRGGDHAFRRLRDRRQGEQGPRRGHARRGVGDRRYPSVRARLVGRPMDKVPPGGTTASPGDQPVGVLALQGDFREHLRLLRSLGAEGREVRLPADLADVSSLVVPGGESTTMSLLLGSSGLLEPLRRRLADGMPALGTCAGMILLGAEIAGRTRRPALLWGHRHFVRRNGFRPPDAPRSRPTSKSTAWHCRCTPFSSVPPWSRRVGSGRGGAGHRAHGRRATRQARGLPPGPGPGQFVPSRAGRRRQAARAFSRNSTKDERK